jgi:uncharacterized membrane protein YecN with MAPEG domain
MFGKDVTVGGHPYLRIFLFLVDHFDLIEIKYKPHMNSILYLAIHGFMTVVLAVRVIRLRWKHKVSLGHGDKVELLTATRVFGNHNEYAPLFLLLLYACETQGASFTLVHSLGILFTFGRLSHAVGLSTRAGPSFGRVLGMTTTFLSIAACSFFLLARARIG